MLAANLNISAMAIAPTLPKPLPTLLIGQLVLILVLLVITQSQIMQLAFQASLVAGVTMMETIPEAKPHQPIGILLPEKQQISLGIGVVK